MTKPPKEKRKTFKSMTLDELREVARVEGLKCDNKEREYLDGVANAPHGGQAFALARSHYWLNGGGRWNGNMSGYLRALRRVFERELRDRNEYHTLRGNPARHTELYGKAK